MVIYSTRKHSSRMRTVRCSGRRGVCASRGRGVCFPGVCAFGGGECVSQHALGRHPLPPCEQNHRCLWKHNLAATMLRTVKIQNRSCRAPQATFTNVSKKVVLNVWQLVATPRCVGLPIEMARDVAYIPTPVADQGARGHDPTDRVKISHKKYGCQRWPHRFHVSWLPATQPLDPLLYHPKTEPRRG